MIPPKTLAIRKSSSMRDTRECIDFLLIQSALVARDEVMWVETAKGAGFVFKGHEEAFFLTYQTAGGAAVHFQGNERALQLCEEVAEELNGVVILM
jgi:hypothetical protein